MVVDSRTLKKNEVRRRRQCTVCEYRFSTYESIHRIDPVEQPTPKPEDVVSENILRKLEEIGKRKLTCPEILSKLEEVDKNQKRAAKLLITRYASLRNRLPTSKKKPEAPKCEYCGGPLPCVDCQDALAGKRKPLDATISKRVPRYNNLLYGERDE